MKFIVSQEEITRLVWVYIEDKPTLTHVYTNLFTVSRHTVVCRAAQEVGAPHREYINRKKENAIFTPM